MGAALCERLPSGGVRTPRTWRRSCKTSAATLEKWLQEVGAPQLLRRNGHYEIWLHAARAAARTRPSAGNGASSMYRTAPAPAELVEAARLAAGAASAGGLWFPDSAHVLDPLEIVRAFAAGAIERGANLSARGSAARCSPPRRGSR